MSKNDFRKNVVTLMTGTTIAQVIPISISPILTRIYTPSDFGVLSLFLAVTYIFASVSSLRYELAIVLPRKDEDAIHISALSFLLTITISFILLIFIFIFHNDIINILDNENIGSWLYFIPLSVFLIGTFNILNYFNTRKKEYKNIATAKIQKAFIGSVIQVLVGIFKTGATGLILGQIISNIFANMKLFSNFFFYKKKYRISKLKMFSLAKRYKNFPKFSMWSILANKLAYHLNDILISVFYSIVTLGYYSIIQRVLGIPASFIGSAVGQVFLQQATQEKKLTGKTNVIFISTIKKMILIALPFFIFLFFYMEDIFSFIFGESWRIAGSYGKILIPFFFMQFIVSTVSTVEIVMEKQKIGLIFNFSFLFICLMVMLLCKEYSFELFLTLFMIAGSIAYFIYGVCLYFISDQFSFGRNSD